MTENIPTNTIATQTPLPRTYLSFASLANKSQTPSDCRSSPFEKQMLENELMLQTQQNALKMIDLKLNEKQIVTHKKREENPSYINKSESDSHEQTSPRNIPEEENSQSILSTAQSNSPQRCKVDGIAFKMVFITFFLEYSSLLKICCTISVN